MQKIVAKLIFRILTGLPPTAEAKNNPRLMEIVAGRIARFLNTAPFALLGLSLILLVVLPHPWPIVLCIWLAVGAMWAVIVYINYLNLRRR